MTLERYLEPLNAFLDFLLGAANFLVKHQLFLGCQLTTESQLPSLLKVALALVYHLFFGHVSNLICNKIIMLNQMHY